MDECLTRRKEKIRPFRGSNPGGAIGENKRVPIKIGRGCEKMEKETRIEENERNKKFRR